MWFFQLQEQVVRTDFAFENQLPDFEPFSVNTDLFIYLFLIWQPSQFQVH